MNVMQSFRKSWLASWTTGIVFMFTLTACPSAQANTSAPTSPPDDDDRKIKIALLLDTSNSMDGLINQAKAQLWRIVNRLAEAECDGETPTLEIALYEYGNDRLNSSEGYIRQVVGLTSDLDMLSSELFRLTTNGGSEYCGHVVQTSLNQLDWDDSDDLQMIFIAGNEPFTQGGVNYVEACTNAKTKGVVVNTIFCGNFDTGISGMWKHGADIANGSYMSIDQNRQTVYIATPYDNRIAELNSDLNQTYYGYGSNGRARVQMQVAQDEAASGLASENLIERAAAKSSSAYYNGSWDIVDAYNNNSNVLDSVTVDELPEELKGLSEEEIDEWIADKTAERASIQAQIRELNEQREEFIANERATQGMDSSDELGSVMIQSIVEQAKAKNFEFPE